MKKILLALGLLVSTIGFSQTKLTFDIYGFGGQSSGTYTNASSKEFDTEGYNGGGGIGIQYNIWGDIHLGADFIGLGSLNTPKGLSNLDLKLAIMNAVLGRLSYTLGFPVGELYASIAAGMYNITGPEINSNNVVVQKETSTSNFGFSPEVGIRIIGFILGVSYTMAGELEYDKPEILNVIDDSKNTKQEYNFWSVKLGYSLSIGF